MFLKERDENKQGARPRDSTPRETRKTMRNPWQGVKDEKSKKKTKLGETEAGDVRCLEERVPQNESQEMITVTEKKGA